MEILSELMLSKGFDAVWGLCTDTITSKIKFSAEQQKINKKIKDYLLEKLKNNWFCTPEEEIDFEGLANYIRGDLLADIEIRLFGEKQERELARKRILEKAAIYASAKTKLSTARAQRMANDVVEMLKVFWRTQVPKELRMMSGEIIDDINQNTTEQIQRFSKEIEQKIDRSSIMSLDKNILSLKNGDIGAVEANINTFTNAISAEHRLPDYYRYEIRRIGNQDRIVSIPTNPEACKLYPPRIRGIACRFVNDELHIRKRIKNIFGRHPVERSHGESVIASLPDSKLFGKVIE